MVKNVRPRLCDHENHATLTPTFLTNHSLHFCHLRTQVDYGFEVLARNNITLDLPAIPQPDTCMYDIEDSCTNNYP